MKINITYKQIAAFLLLIAFLAQTYSKGFIMAGYYTNTAAYAKNCVNKAIPKMHCNGKCQMMKKLQQEENRDKQNPVRRNDSKNEVLYFSAGDYAVVEAFSSLTTITYSPFSNTPAKGISFSFFQPPRV